MQSKTENSNDLYSEEESSITLSSSYDLNEEFDREESSDLEMNELILQDLKIIMLVAVPLIAKAFGTFIIRKCKINF